MKTEFVQITGFNPAHEFQKQPAADRSGARAKVSGSGLSPFPSGRSAAANGAYNQAPENKNKSGQQKSVMSRSRSQPGVTLQAS